MLRRRRLVRQGIRVQVLLLRVEDILQVDSLIRKVKQNMVKVNHL